VLLQRILDAQNSVRFVRQHGRRDDPKDAFWAMVFPLGSPAVWDVMLGLLDDWPQVCHLLGELERQKKLRSVEGL
jgi:hypothetical protein